MTGTAIRFFSSSQHRGLLDKAADFRTFSDDCYLYDGAYGFECFINSSIDGLNRAQPKKLQAPFGLEIGSANKDRDDALTRGVTSGLRTTNPGEGEPNTGKEDESRADIDRR